MRNFDEWVTDPVVTREDVEAFVADESLVGSPYLGRYLAATTSGTTGHPAIFLHDEGALAVYNAIGYVRAMPALLSWPDVRRLLRGGARAAAVYATGGHFFAVAVLERRLRARPWRARMQRIFSVLAPLDELVGDVNAFGPAMLASYPSMLEVLAREQQAGRLRIRPVLVSAGGETLTPEVRGRIEAAFGCPVRDVYGSSEAVGVTYECGQRWLHVSADWYVLEPVDRDYNPTPPGVASHTVLVTNLANRVQPIIRYDQGDSVTLRPDACPCGSPLPAIRVVGRTNDTLSFQTAEGREVRLLPLALGTVIEETPGVRRFQAVKTAPRVLSIRLDAEPGSNPQRVWAAVASRLKEYLSARGLSEVSVERSPEQPQPNLVSGKFRQVWAEA
jgi:phenylacetate-coenzyme A ligase PaaK-like adenylate-forming protein